MPSTLPAAPTEVKRRTITLTNRAPIRIAEDNWPVIAQGECNGGDPECPWWGWKITIHIREEKIEAQRDKLLPSLPQYLIHAKYHAWNESEETPDTNVRVGRLLSSTEAACDLWKHIGAVGDELRERVGRHETAHWRITRAIDECFASLPPHEMR
jgi:hypothetical protein